MSIGAANRPRRRPAGTGDGCGPGSGCYKFLQMKCSFCGNGDAGRQGMVPDARTAIAGACRMGSPYHFVEVTAGFGLFRRLKDNAADPATIAPIDSISGGSSSKITVLNTGKITKK
ncbi:MAG: hypothetical protein JNM13_06725 [Hyphomicrobiaceae bacterium]|nr:hypothetical protein [Hyphomicrobiaceae bacterium]